MFSEPATRFATACALLIGSWMASSPLQAGYETLWELGAVDGNPQEFGTGAHQSLPSPGSATAQDDDYYFAGTYPPPIGQIAQNEPLGQFEGQIPTWWPQQRLHFSLTAAQATSTARLRCVMHLVWGYFGGAKGFGTHHVEVRLNGALLGSGTVTQSATLVIEGEAPAVTPRVGANTLEIRRAGGSPDGAVSFDALSLSIHSTATVDADADLLPLWYEEDQGLDDLDPTDASADLDHDGWSALQEFVAGTDPRLADTDGDGLLDSQESITNPLLADTDGDTLSDGDELSQVPPLNPTLPDSDNDGAPDAWEIATGYLPHSAASTPPAYDAAIGIQFVSELHPDAALPPLAVAGYAPQTHWNTVRPLTSWNDFTGGTADIVGPVPATLVDSSGTPRTTTFSWSSESAWAGSASGSSNARLLNAFLSATPTAPASVSLSAIPFATYDVILYVGSWYDGPRGFARLNDDPASDSWFQSLSNAPNLSLIEPIGSTPARPWQGNVIRFRGVSGAHCNLKLFEPGDDVGIHAVQIVDATRDTDSDLMPDWWEIRHRLAFHSGADAGLDPDNDGLTHRQEFSKQTDPHLADTDADGLLDGVETGTGIWISAANTGTDPLRPDSDGDGLTDGAEASGRPQATNPNLADSDADGRPDSVEIAAHTDPLSPTLATSQTPVITTSPARTFLWDLGTLQIRWDHTRGAVSDNEWGDAYLLTFAIRNSLAPHSDALRFGLRTRHHALTHFLYLGSSGGFSAPGSPSEDLWHSDWNSPPTDLSAALGFSGHGPFDLSDRLRLSISGSASGGASTWNLTLQIENLDTTTTVYSHTFTGCRAAPSVHNGTVLWQDSSSPPQPLQPDFQHHDGVEFFFLDTPLHDLPTYAAWRDSDNDGMTDAWEDLHTLNKFDAADASSDLDLDDLTHLQEFLIGTLPRVRDTDSDGVPDGIEHLHRSDPLLASSQPAAWHSPPSPSLLPDGNQNGLPDPWELWIGRFDLSPHVDSDADGMTNAQEALAGTDPFDPDSHLWSLLHLDPPQLTLRWPDTPFKTAAPQQNTTLTSSGWTAVPGIPTWDHGQWRLPLGSATGPPRFFRVSITDRDTDADGVSDWVEENVLGSDRLSPDSLHTSVPFDANADGTPDGLTRGDRIALSALLDGTSPGSGSAGESHPPPTPRISPAQAARFLQHASFGPTLDSIDRVRTLGYTAWIAEQIALPPTLHSTYIQHILADLHGPRSDLRYSYSDMDDFVFGNNLMTAFARAAIHGDDQLRQRVAFALSQILVTSRRDANLENQVGGMADYYDIFVRHAFGSYLHILEHVTFHPVMGRYLSHIGNEKARPEINQFPDENYARELMQLFTIGLWQLHPDGTRQLSGGQPIPTYSNTEITETARVLTGLWFGGHNWGQGGFTNSDYSKPMTMHFSRHDFGHKTLVGGHPIAARAATPANAIRDVRDTLRILFHHPNTAPFVSRQLIQFLVTDNPSPAYVARIAALFADNGSGLRGDLGTVIPALLLDPEARAPRQTHTPTHDGRLKEPVIRAMALARAFGLRSVPDLLWWDWDEFYSAARQEPTRSPSVFNFYRPDYRAPGLLTQQALAAPVFQITDSFSSIAFPNHLWQIITDGFSLYDLYRFPLDITREIALAATPEHLVDHLNLLCCAGQMTATTRQLILTHITQIPSTRPTDRARLALYLALVTPEGAIMR